MGAEAGGGKEKVEKQAGRGEEGTGEPQSGAIREEEEEEAEAAPEHRRLEGPPGRGAKPRPRLGGELSGRAPACNCWEKWLRPDSDLAQGEGSVPTGLGAGGQVADRPSPSAPSAETCRRRAPVAGSAAAASPAGSRAAAPARSGPRLGLSRRRRSGKFARPRVRGEPGPGGGGGRWEGESGGAAVVVVRRDPRCWQGPVVGALGAGGNIYLQGSGINHSWLGKAR